MDYFSFLEKIIEDGIKAAKSDYIKDEDSHKLKSSLEGFELCIGKTPSQIKEIYNQTLDQLNESVLKQNETKEHFRISCRWAKVAWVANVVSVKLWLEGKQTIIPPTMRGVLKAVNFGKILMEVREELRKEK